MSTPRIGRDSTKATDIPVAGTQVAIGYGNGFYLWDKSSWERFPDAAHCVVDVSGGLPTADMLDIEKGDADVPMAVKWVRQKRHVDPNGYPPILYANRSTLTPLFNALNAAGFKVVTDFRLAIATLDGTKTVSDMTGVWGVQYGGEAQTGHHYDEWLIYDDAWKPVGPGPAPSPVQHGTLVHLPDGASRGVSSTDGGKTWV